MSNATTEKVQAVRKKVVAKLHADQAEGTLEEVKMLVKSGMSPGQLRDRLAELLFPVAPPADETNATTEGDEFPSSA